jgi:hypothetical protein
MKSICIGILLVLFMINGCSSAPRKEEHRLKQIFLYNLHFRRPPQVGANPKAYPWEEDFEKHPRPTATFDCEPLSQLFRSVDLSSVQKCFETLSQNSEKRTFSYRLNREPALFFELKDSEEAPLCLREKLNRIPVPREIFFQSKDEEQLSCYSARLAIQDEEFLGIRSTLQHLDLNITFPLTESPQSNEELLMLLKTYAIAPFWTQESEGKRLISRPVPQTLCEKCLGKKNLFLDKDALPPLWP